MSLKCIGLMKLLSIIIPVYNLEKYMAKCLDSIYNQGVDEASYEVIAVDDGSKDRSLAILNEYATRHSNLKVIHQENAGVSVARNNAMKEALGQFMTFVDGDDMIAEDSLANIEQIIIKNNFCFDVCYCRSFHVFTDGRQEETHLWQGQFDDNTLYNGQELKSRYYINGGSVWGGVYRAKYLNEIGLKFAVGIANGEDTIFNYLLYAYNPKIIFADIKLNLVIVRDGSATHSYSMDRVKRFGISIKSLQEIEQEIERKDENSENIQQAIDASFYHIISMAVNMYINQGGKDYCYIRDLLDIKHLHKLSVPWLPKNQRSKMHVLNISFYLYYKLLVFKQNNLRLYGKLNSIFKSS